MHAKQTCYTMLLLMSCALQVSAQSYPAKALRIVVPFPAGGGVDTQGNCIK